MSSVLLVSGSPVAGSRSLALARHVGRRLAADGLRVRCQDVRDLPAQDLIWARGDSPAIRSACQLVAEADALVLVTPVYKAAYSGVLKTFLDLLPQAGLQGKVVVPLAIGGTLAHLLVIDYALRPVLSTLGAPHVVSGVFLLDSWVHPTHSGGVLLEQAAAERLESAMRELRRALAGATSAALPAVAASV